MEMARYLLHYQLPPSEFWTLTRAQKAAIRHTAEAINQERK